MSKPNDQWKLLYDTIALDISLAGKVVRLWAIAMLNYRQPVGEEALEKIGELMGNDARAAIMYIAGFSSGNPKREDYERLLQSKD